MIGLDARQKTRAAADAPATTPSRTRLQRLLREPLLHFVLVGALVFFAAEAWRSYHDVHRIVVTEETVASLAGKHRLQFGRAPTQAELERLISGWIEEEALYREGRAMGLDREDEIVRRRVVQKVSFLRQDLALPPEPTEADLERYFRAHAARYAQPARTSFRHLYFSPDKGGSQAAQHRAQDALARLGAGAAPEAVGADPFPDQSAYAGVGPTEARRLFGDTPMAAAVGQAPPGRWSGPVRSGYGWHLIRVEARADAAPAQLGPLRDAVRADWIDDAQAAANARAMAALKARYTIVRRDGRRP